MPNPTQILLPGLSATGPSAVAITGFAFIGAVATGIALSYVYEYAAKKVNDKLNKLFPQN